jgi:hypothetical protein
VPEDGGWLPYGTAALEILTKSYINRMKYLPFRGKALHAVAIIRGAGLFF